MIFSIPESAREDLFGDNANNFPEHLAYVELFTRFRQHPEPWHGLHRVKRAMINNARVQNERAAVIIPVDRIQRSVSLVPRFGREVNPAWTAANVLEMCPEFYVNTFSDRHAYITMP